MVDFIMKKERGIDKIEFYYAEATNPPLSNCTIGYSCFNKKWMKDSVSINGKQLDVPAVLFSEFELMLERQGDYWPFTCTCDNPGCANIDWPVRCFHKDDLIVLVIRDPVQECLPCETCDEESTCTLNRWQCPYQYKHYHAYCFSRSAMRQSLDNCREIYRAALFRQ